MAVGDEMVKGVFAELPAWARHTISVAVIGGLMVFGFVEFVRDPVAQAAETDRRQDTMMAAHQRTLNTLSEVVAKLAQTQAVQTNMLAERDRRLDRIEDKIDALRRGR